MHLVEHELCSFNFDAGFSVRQIEAILTVNVTKILVRKEIRVAPSGAYFTLFREFCRPMNTKTRCYEHENVVCSTLILNQISENGSAL